MRHYRSFGWGWGSSKQDVAQQTLTSTEPLLTSTSSFMDQVPLSKLPFEPSPIISPAIEKLKAEAQQFSNYIPDTSDFGNLMASLKPNPTPESLVDTVSNFSLSPGSLYTQLDEFSRTATLFLADDLGLGMGTAIVVISCAIKLFFLPLQLKLQTQGMKMKLIGPEMKIFQDKTKKASQKGDYAIINEERDKFAELRKLHGINPFMSILGLAQLPFLITWFLSLRHMAMNPDLFPKMATEGLLWFKDLTEYDHFFILPLISAFCSSMNIARSPMAAGGGMGGPAFAKYMRFMRFLPFLGFPILMFFPSGMTLYWSVVSFLQLLITLVTRSKHYKRWVGMENYLPGTILHKQFLKQKELDLHAQQLKAFAEKPRVAADNVKREALKAEEGLLKIKSEAGQKMEVFDKKPKKPTN